MKFRKMVTVTLYARQQKRHRYREQSFELLILYWEMANQQWCYTFLWIVKGCSHTYTCIHSPPNFPPICHITFSSSMCSTIRPCWFSSVQSLSCVWLFATPWIAARQAFLSITNSRSSLRLTAIEAVMPSSHLTLCRPLLLCCMNIQTL